MTDQEGPLSDFAVQLTIAQAQHSILAWMSMPNGIIKTASLIFLAEVFPVLVQKMTAYQPTRDDVEGLAALRAQMRVVAEGFLARSFENEETTEEYVGPEPEEKDLMDVFKTVGLDLKRDG